ncbi:MAG: prephenate dehydrogenase [Clostridiales bacterium]|jgi:prephenate dehydrogenase|nr:prephenate dehydrogenase [Clostridiales bacterium]
MEKFTVGIEGLGLIGASFARGFKKRCREVTVLADNRTRATLDKALDEGTVDGVLDKDSIGSVDLLIVALYPEAAVRYLEEMAPLISADTIVTDVCGLKRYICKEGFRLADEYGFTFIGGHPMAGTQFSGYDNSKADMFVNASMILVPDPSKDGNSVLGKLETIKEMLGKLEFGRFVITTPENHDRMIAMTSQMAHLVSSCYVKSPGAEEAEGFTGGSFQDLTRVAYLNAGMWTELFMENQDYLLAEIEAVQKELERYRAAIAASDSEELYKLLDEGSKIKERILRNGQD